MKKSLLNTLATTAILAVVILATLLISFAPRANAESAAFAADIEISCEASDIHYGDEVTLKANTDGEVIWQAMVDGEWQNVASGSNSYSFIVTAENAGLQYRVVLCR